MRNIYAAVGVVVVILAIIIFAFVRSRLPQNSKQAGISTTPTVTPLAKQQTNATISTSTVSPSKTVVVDSETADKAGFLVVSENNNGQPGTILGQSDLLQPGKHDNVAIPINRKSVDGENLLISFYQDNGDGKFDQNTDQVVKSNSGSTLVSTLKVSNAQPGQQQIPATGLGEDDY